MKSWLVVAVVGCGAPASPVSVADRFARGDEPTLHEPSTSKLTFPTQRGRVWIAAAGSPIVFELIDAGHPIAVIGDVRDGELNAFRIYRDSLHAHPTLQTPVSTDVMRGGANDAALVAIANQSWAGMNAHSGAQTMASAAEGYTLDDFAAPKILDRAGTEEMVDRFLHAVENFHVTSSVQFAAGNDVISENVETMVLQGKPITLHALDIKHIEGGRVVAEWQYADGGEIQRAMAGSP
ncbi:MAG: hypothetical protein QM831_34010 [Kofleriaceae bacterium]